MHAVAVLVLDGTVPLDMSIAYDAFAITTRRDGRAAYRVRVCSEARTTASGRDEAFKISTRWGLKALASADTIIVPGFYFTRYDVTAAVIKALRSACKRGARIASICSGAFVLAEAGLLDGKRATTHWQVTDELARRFPRIAVDPNVLFVDEGRIITSAGVLAGMDMCLHLIEKDFGQAVAAETARKVLAPLRREGGQAQFIRQEPPTSAISLAPLLKWMTENLDKSLDVEMLADRACASPRTFARRFREQTGASPIQWLLTARVRRAQELLEKKGARVDEVAVATGFESPVTFRARFKRVVGISPAAYQRRFAAAA